MTDEEKLKQTWKDAREQLNEDKPFSQTKISLYVTVALVAVVGAVAYMSYTSMGIMEEIQILLEGANKTS